MIVRPPQEGWATEKKKTKGKGREGVERAKGAEWFGVGRVRDQETADWRVEWKLVAAPPRERERPPARFRIEVLEAGVAVASPSTTQQPLTTYKKALSKKARSTARH
jgi:hypothetical protein